MPENSEDTGQTKQGLSRRGFVGIVRDSVIVLLLPLTLGCRFLRSEARPPKAVTEEAQLSAYQVRFFTEAETATVEAFTDRIIPKDERPGAKDARVVHFIDNMLMTSYVAQQEFYRVGVRQLNNLSLVRFKGPFTGLTQGEQDALLAQMERRQVPDWKEAGDFFATVRVHTIEGMLSDPKYYGNAGRIGWELLGVYD